MSFLNSFNKNKIREDKVTFETVTGLFLYFLLATYYYVRKNTNYKIIFGLVFLYLMKDLYGYFSKSKVESIDGLEVPPGGDNYNLTI